MNIQEIKKLKIGKIIENIDLKDYTTYKAGGTARVLAIPKTADCLIKLLNYIEKNSIKYKVIGSGSNLLFGDGVYNGILIKLDEFRNLEIKKNSIIVGAGYSLIKLALQAAKNDLTGLEFASGIPGTVGGSIYMNAGAYNSDMGYVVKSARILTPDKKIIFMSNSELNFHYRTSFLQENPGYICLEAKIVLTKGKKEAILNVISDRKKRRIEAQPLEYPSAGSVFRNPANDYAGRLVEDLGYKGKVLGGAMVSEKHANFIVNKKNAKASDIKTLILEIQKKVKDKYNIELHIEQEFIE